jgi:hypothetical protein
MGIMQELNRLVGTAKFIPKLNAAYAEKFSPEQRPGETFLNFQTGSKMNTKSWSNRERRENP